MKFVTRLFTAAGIRAAAFPAILSLLGMAASPAQAAPPVGLLAASLPTQAGYGSIKGRLVWGGAEAPPRKIEQTKGMATKDPNVCAKSANIMSDTLVVDPKSKGIRDAFAYLVNPVGKNPEAYKEILAKAPSVQMDQVNCTFVPHVLALVADQPVEFKSSDATSHNLRLAALTNLAFNELLPSNGVVEKKFIPEKRPLQLKCDLHTWMTGWLMVFDHPFFAITGDDGSFEIKGVPAGPQTIVLWQESVGYATPGFGRGMPVVVKAGEASDIGEIKLDPAKVKN